MCLCSEIQHGFIQPSDNQELAGHLETFLTQLYDFVSNNEHLMPYLLFTLQRKLTPLSSTVSKPLEAEKRIAKIYKFYCVALHRCRAIRRQSDDAKTVARKIFPIYHPGRSLEEAGDDMQSLIKTIEILIQAGPRYENIAKKLGFGSLFLLGDTVPANVWERWLPYKGSLFEQAMSYLMDKGIIDLGEKYEEVAKKIINRFEDILPKSAHGWVSHETAGQKSSKRKSNYQLKGTNKKNKNHTTKNSLDDSGNRIETEPAAPDHTAEFPDQFEVDSPGNDRFRPDFTASLSTSGTSITAFKHAIVADPAASNSNPISIDALLNAADYIAESTQNQQLATARNSPIQITNGAVLSGYEQDSIADEYAEFGSRRGVKRGLESQAEACDSSSKQRRIHSFSGLDSSLSQSSNTRSAYQTEAIGTNIAIMAEVCKLESPLGVQLFKGMDATYIRDLEKQRRWGKFTDAVRLHLPSPEAKDYKLEVWICPSIGKVISQAKESAKDLRDVLDEYLFDAVNTSDWKKEQERNGLQGFAGAVTVSFPKGDDGSDCKVEIILSAEKGSEFYENVFPFD
ncbi:hypothetical protein SBOR_5562 [Sclerotinia borealis F-4128]|uniref:Uncharacterized protein n=1 Tax=Sclerotinia borealis (strain F-4128) TaxID=1432307 RepID=W9CDU3_SCLBF|nr:hypothetical protein SBOR_5562 [Sclerotinia borealis F-4128]